MKGNAFPILILTSAFIILFSNTASSLSVAMDVGEELNGEIKSINSSLDNGIYWISVEFYNSGSLGYRATSRLDVFNGSRSIFTYWTDSREMAPGKKEYFTLYGYVPSSGNYSTRLRVYFANEILEKWYPVRYWNVYERASAFSARNFATGKEYDRDYLEFDLSSETEIGKMLVLPAKYPRGWIFPGLNSSLSANQTLRQRLFFEPDMPSPGNISIIMVSSDGKYSDEYSISLKKEDGILAGFISFLASIFGS